MTFNIYVMSSGRDEFSGRRRHRRDYPVMSFIVNSISDYKPREETKLSCQIHCYIFLFGFHNKRCSINVQSECMTC